MCRHQGTIPIDEQAAICKVDIVQYETAYQAGVVSVIIPIQREEFGLPIALEDQPDLRDIPSFYQTGAGNF
jgi:hypothetical protein